MRKRRLIIFVIVLLSIMVVAAAIFVNPRPQPTLTTPDGSRYTLRFPSYESQHGSMYYLNAATSNAARTKGLSGKRSLPSNEGMLFVFPQEYPECFWMKDMHFSIDMLWLDKDKRVVHLKENVSPGTYPATFCPPKPAKYVIELNAGEAARSEVKVGQRLDF